MYFIERGEPHLHAFKAERHAKCFWSRNASEAFPDGLSLQCISRRPRLQVIWADREYQGPKLHTWLGRQANWISDIVHRPPRRISRYYPTSRR